MYNQEMLKKLIIWTDTVLKFLVYHHHFALFHHFLVRRNRMLNPWHKVNKLLNKY